MFCAVDQPIELQVDCFASILLEGAVDDAVGRVIISSYWPTSDSAADDITDLIIFAMTATLYP